MAHCLITRLGGRMTRGRWVGVCVVYPGRIPLKSVYQLLTLFGLNLRQMTILVNLTSSHSSGSTFAIGDTIVTYTAGDASSNSVNATFTITIQGSSTRKILGGSVLLGFFKK